MLEPVRPVRLEAAYRLRSRSSSLLAALVGLLGIGALLHLATVGAGQRRVHARGTFGVLGCAPRQRRGAVAVGLLVVVGGVGARRWPCRWGWSQVAAGLVHRRRWARHGGAPAVVPALGLVAVVVVIGGDDGGARHGRRSAGHTGTA